RACAPGGRLARARRATRLVGGRRSPGAAAAAVLSALCIHRGLAMPCRRGRRKRLFPAPRVARAVLASWREARYDAPGANENAAKPDVRLTRVRRFTLRSGGARYKEC